MDIPNRNDIKIVKEGNRNRSESVDQLQQRPKLNLLDKPQDSFNGRQASASSILNSYSDISTPRGVTTPDSKTLGKFLIWINSQNQAVDLLNTFIYD